MLQDIMNAGTWNRTMLQRGSFTGKQPPLTSSLILGQRLPASINGSVCETDDGSSCVSCKTWEDPDLEGITAAAAQVQVEPPKPSSALKVKTVRFSKVHVHFHDTVLGDNPSVSSGAPLAIGWQRLWTESHPVHLFEADQMPLRNPSGGVPKLAAGVRQRLLREAGESHVNIYLRVEQIDSLRYHQQESIRRAVTAKKPKAKKSHSSSPPALLRTVKSLFVRGPSSKTAA